MSEEELQERNDSFTVKTVREWSERHGGIKGRLRWFEVYALNSKLYQLVIKPLMSIRTTGSIDVERAVKPIKKDILTKSRNRMSNNKAMVLFRTSENVRQLFNMRREFRRMSCPMPSASASNRSSLNAVVVSRDPNHTVDLLGVRGEESSSESEEEN